MLKISDLARADIEQIWLYISKQNIDSAHRTIFEIEQRLSMLSFNPRIGKVRTDVSRNMRTFPYKNYSIIYVIEGNNVRITRILHQSRNIKKLL